MYKQANDFNEEIRHEVRGGTGDVSFQHIYAKGSELNENMRLFARLVLEEGCSIGYHVHENEAEIYYILSGTAETDDNGVKRILKPGDSTMTRSGEGHSIKALGPGKLEFIATIVSC
jgi:mannose-6-phosphate isomerase-like protein (cupin superfamily)